MGTLIEIWGGGCPAKIRTSSKPSELLQTLTISSHHGRQFYTRNWAKKLSELYIEPPNNIHPVFAVN